MIGQEDAERATFSRLYERLSMEQDTNAFLRNAYELLRFLDTAPNPAYADALVTHALSRAHLLVLSLLNEPPTYARMMTKRVCTSALNIESVWRRILGDNASNASE